MNGYSITENALICVRRESGSATRLGLASAFLDHLPELGLLVGRQDSDDLLAAFLAVGHGGENLFDLGLLRIGQVQLGQHLFEALRPLALLAVIPGIG